MSSKDNLRVSECLNDLNFRRSLVNEARPHGANTPFEYASYVANQYSLDPQTALGWFQSDMAAGEGRPRPQPGENPHRADNNPAIGFMPVEHSVLTQHKGQGSAISSAGKIPLPWNDPASARPRRLSLPDFGRGPSRDDIGATIFPGDGFEVSLPQSMAMIAHDANRFATMAGLYRAPH